MSNVFPELFEVIKERRNNPQQGSYTCYLFDAGLDKILKKLGEEASETIIAAKNENAAELVGEMCDLIYHMFVLAVQKGVKLEEIMEELSRRAEKIGNLKEMKNTDRNT